MTATLDYSITNQSQNLCDNNDEIAIVDSYPLHNVVEINKNEHCLMISLPGFNEDDLKITTRLSELNEIEVVVKGTPPKTMCTSKASVLHKQFDIKKFEKVYKLLPFMQVSSIEITNGILGILFSQFEPLGLGALQFDSKIKQKAKKVVQVATVSATSAEKIAKPVKTKAATKG